MADDQVNTSYSNNTENMIGDDPITASQANTDSLPNSIDITTDNNLNDIIMEDAFASDIGIDTKHSAIGEEIRDYYVRHQLGN